MLTVSELAKPISHEARRELQLQQSRIAKLESALQKIAAIREMDYAEVTLTWAIETARNALSE